MNIKIERPKREEENSLSLTFSISFDSDPKNVEGAFNKMLTFMRENMPREEFEDIARELLAKMEKHKQTSVVNG
jgi:hypothetical protein